MSSFFMGGLPTLSKDKDFQQPGDFKKQLDKIVHRKDYEQQEKSIKF